MSKYPHPIPGDFLSQVFATVKETGRPLLREARGTDIHTVFAVRDSSGGYELTLDSVYDTEDLGSIQTCGEMAGYFGISVDKLIDELRESGFSWINSIYIDDVDAKLEEEDERAGIDVGSLDPAALEQRRIRRDELIEAVSFPEPNDARDCLRHLLPGPTLGEVLADALGVFAWDPETISPGEPPAEARAPDGLLDLGRLAITEERRGGVSEKVCWVDSAVALSCLQYVLDESGEGVRIDEHKW